MINSRHSEMDTMLINLGLHPAVLSLNRGLKLVVGWLGPVDVAQLSLSPAEVQQAFLAPFSTLRDPALKSWHKVNGSKVKMPMFGGCEHKVWGLTAYILHQLLDEIDHAL